MSYDVYLTIRTGPDSTFDIFDINHTSNCSKMFTMALGGLHISELHGMNALDAAVILREAYLHMTDPENEAAYKNLNPPNGWGSHESATEFITSILTACDENPYCALRISC